MQPTTGQGHDAAAALLSLSTASQEPQAEPLPPQEGGLLQSLMAAAMSVNLPPRSSLVDADAPMDSPPLKTRRPRTRKRESGDGDGPPSVKDSKGKKPKAQGVVAGAHLDIAPSEQIRVDTDKPLDELLRDWVGARGLTPSGGVAPALWRTDQMADAIRRRIVHENPDYNIASVKLSLKPVLDRLAKLRGEDHTRAVEALCLAVNHRKAVREALGRLLVSEAERLGDQLGPTIRLAVRLLGKDTLITQGLPGLEGDKRFKAGEPGNEGKASKGKGKGKGAGKAAPQNLLGEVVDTRPKLAGTIWRSIIEGLRDAESHAGEASVQDDIVRTIQMAITRGGPDWAGLPVMFDALAQACGRRDMPPRLLERTAALLMRAPAVVIQSDGAAWSGSLPGRALQSLCKGLSATGWNPAHQQVLRAQWQEAGDPDVMRAQARALEPLMHDAQEAPLALATHVREALDAANGMAAARFVARITGPLQAFLERPSVTVDQQLALIDILCANLAPGLDRLPPEHAMTVLQRLSGGVATYANRQLIERFFHGLLNQGVATPMLAHTINAHGNCIAALESTAVGQVPPLSCERSQAIARITAQAIPVSPPGRVINRAFTHALVEALAKRTPALPPEHWVAWISGFAQALVNRDDLGARMAVLLNGLAIEGRRMGPDETEAFGWALAKGLGGRTIPPRAQGILLEQLAVALPLLPVAAVPPFLRGLEAAFGGQGMDAELLSELNRVTASFREAPPRAAGIAGGTSTDTPVPPTTAKADPATQRATPIQQIHQAVSDLVGRVHGDDASATADPALRAAFESAMQRESDPERAIRVLGRAIQVATRSAAGLLRSPPLAIGPARKAPPVIAWHMTVRAIARTARALVDAPMRPVLADAVTRWLRTGDGSAIMDTSPSGNLQGLAFALFHGLQVADTGDALNATVRAITEPPPPATSPTVSSSATATPPGPHAQAIAAGLRQALAQLAGAQAKLDEAMDLMLHVSPTPAGLSQARIHSLITQRREALLGLIGGVDGIPAAMVTTSRKSLESMLRLMLHFAGGVPGRGLGYGGPAADASETAVLRTLLAEPQAGQPSPALTDGQAWRMTMALTLANDAALAEERLRLLPSIKGLVAHFEPPARPAATLAGGSMVAAPQASPKRLALCKEAVLFTRRPDRLLANETMPAHQTVELMCELYELPRAWGPALASHSLAMLASYALPAEVKLAGAVRLMRSIAPRIGPRSLASARRELTEVVRGLEYDVTKAPEAEREQAQARHQRAVTQVREFYQGLLRYPDIARLLASSPASPRPSVANLDKQRALLAFMQMEIEELQRPHQPSWLVQELLPIARQAQDALRQSVDANAQAPAPSSSSSSKDPS